VHVHPAGSRGGSGRWHPDQGDDGEHGGDRGGGDETA
jgi:hypothetical protein